MNFQRTGLLAVAACLAVACLPAAAQTDLDAKVDSHLSNWMETYEYLHQHPELSTEEKDTAAYVAAALAKMGYEVTDHFGKYDDGSAAYGVVAVLRNGPGPTLYLRTELDGLPVTEETGLAYASKVREKRAGGGEVGVMHACGHDLHMTVLLGTAKMMLESEDQWSGTLVLIGQPAEETVAGAAAMLRAGLYTKFPKPDYVVALHDSSFYPAGTVAWHAGPMLAGADSVDITIRGYGGHGAAPQITKDPIVIGAEIVMALQTIVSRESDPLVPTVVTVGSFHAGTKHNIIPDEAHLQLTVRTMTPAQREKVLAAIKRITDGIAESAGIPPERAPIIEVAKDHVPATINDPVLTQRVAISLEKALGKDNVWPGRPLMASEDFSLFALEDPKPPICMFWLGAPDPAKWKAAEETGARLPGPHSSEFAPLPEPAIRAGVKGMTTVAIDLLKK
ncbi:MAG TPA: amidohydrolase [Candidatus Eisenbacteria bacterium]|nr:amidohydrolase [Candidatus Eisenbacteria bacterium]